MTREYNRRSGKGPQLKQVLVEKHGKRCWKCKNEFDYLELDHINPLWNMGKDDIDNLQLLCYDCHKEKTRIDVRFYYEIHPVIYIVNGVEQPPKKRKK